MLLFTGPLGLTTLCIAVNTKLVVLIVGSFSSMFIPSLMTAVPGASGLKALDCPHQDLRERIGQGSGLGM